MPTQAQKAVTNYPEHYRWCRASMHQWQVGSGIELLEEMPNMVLVSFHCDMCGLTRRDKVNYKNGDIVVRTYHHPEGYLIKGLGDDRPTKSHWRKKHYSELVDRARKLAKGKLDG